MSHDPVWNALSRRNSIFSVLIFIFGSVLIKEESLLESNDSVGNEWSIDNIVINNQPYNPVVAYMIEYLTDKTLRDCWSNQSVPRTCTLSGGVNTKYIRISIKKASESRAHVIDNTNNLIVLCGASDGYNSYYNLKFSSNNALAISKLSIIQDLLQRQTHGHGV